MVATCRSHTDFFFLRNNCISRGEIERVVFFVFAVINDVLLRGFARFFYLLNIPTVNNLTVCHPRRRRPILSAQMGALLKAQADFTPTISARCLFVRHFLGLKVCPNYRSSSSL